MNRKIPLDLLDSKKIVTFATMKKTHFLLLFLCLQSLMCLAQGDGFAIDTLNQTVFAHMQGRSFPKDCTIARADLRHLTIMHYDAQGREHRGELVCHKRIADDLIDIFQQLYQARYPIERMQLVDDYDADDEQSMTANNTSCFCFRTIAGSQRLSKHSMGMAIDINPLYNPCVSKRRNGSRLIQPAAGKQYADRSKDHPYKITKGDLCYRLFLAHGFSWGGDWRSKKDYQHFEKDF